MSGDLGICPVKRVNVSDQVYEQLKQLLIQGTWKPGDKLPSETELSEMFGVSRVTLRQALQKLGTLGLLETRLGEGTFVKNIEAHQMMNELLPLMYLSRKNAEDILEFRELMDSESVKLATQRATEEDFQKLEDLIGQMVEAGAADDLQTFADADLEFHLLIGEITGNTLIIRTSEILRDVIQNAVNDLIAVRGYRTGIYYHRKILETMRRRDADEAMRLMRVHLRLPKGAELIE